MPHRSHRRAWAIVDRAPGESHEHWTMRCRQAHRQLWEQDKIQRGEWLPAEEYARQSGRPGKVLHPAHEQVAALKREQVNRPLDPQAPGVQSPGVEAPTPQPSGLPDAPSPADPSLPHQGPVPAVQPLQERLYEDAMGVAYGAAFSAGMAALGEVVRNGANCDAVEVAKKAGAVGAQAALKGVAVRGVEIALEEGVQRLGAALVQESGKAIAKQAAASTGKEIARQTLSATAKNFVRGNAIGAAAGLVVEQGVDTFRWLHGDIDGAEYGRRSAENVASSGGGLGGAAAGAAIGTAIFPGVGTAVGAFVGGALGSLGGGKLASKLVR